MGFLYGYCHITERLFMLFGVGLAAIRTAKALQPIPMLPKATAFDPAVLTSHRSLGFGVPQHKIIIQQGLAVIQGFFRQGIQCVYIGCLIVSGSGLTWL